MHSICVIPVQDSQYCPILSIVQFQLCDRGVRCRISPCWKLGECPGEASLSCFVLILFLSLLFFTMRNGIQSWLFLGVDRQQNDLEMHFSSCWVVVYRILENYQHFLPFSLLLTIFAHLFIGNWEFCSQSHNTASDSS